MAFGWKVMLPLSLVNLLVTGRGIAGGCGDKADHVQHASNHLGSYSSHTFRKTGDHSVSGRRSPICRRAGAGRIILSRDPDGEERCVACYLCAVACPVDCIALQATEDEHGRRYPEFFRINFSRCIFCGFCEEACPTYAIQLTPDFEMGEYERQNLVYEKEDLLISGHRASTPTTTSTASPAWRSAARTRARRRTRRRPVDVQRL